MHFELRQGLGRRGPRETRHGPPDGEDEADGNEEDKGDGDKDEDGEHPNTTKTAETY